MNNNNYKEYKLSDGTTYSIETVKVRYTIPTGYKFRDSLQIIHYLDEFRSASRVFYSMELFKHFLNTGEYIIFKFLGNILGNKKQ